MTGENIEDLFIVASKILYNNFKDKIAQMVSTLTSELTYLINIERRGHEKKEGEKVEKISRKRRSIRWTWRRWAKERKVL